MTADSPSVGYVLSSGAMPSRRSGNNPMSPSPGLTPGSPAEAHCATAPTDTSFSTATPSARHIPLRAADGPSPVSNPTTSQQQLTEYRERLARDLEKRELLAKGATVSSPSKVDVSPIAEEATVFTPPWVSSSIATTSSTESGHTVRGGMTPAMIASTPSYPFPRMQIPVGGGFQYLQGLHSPTARFAIAMPPDSRPAFDTVLSDNSTPASNFTFNTASKSHREDGEFASPDLYQLSLLLSAEPGLEAWWNTVVQIMRDAYKAERVTLAVPADTTDIRNVPWGQKATFNEHPEDDLSLGYIAKASSGKRSDVDRLDNIASPPDASWQSATPSRPNMTSRYSYTTYEDNKKRQSRLPAARRPGHPIRSETTYQPATTTTTTRASNGPFGVHRLEKSALEEHDAEENQQQNIPSWEIPFLARYDGQGRVHSVLQALDYEADPLIDHAGVVRVLERGRPVALTRTYPYLPRTQAHGESGDSGSKRSTSDFNRKAKLQRAESTSKLSSMLSGSKSWGSGKSNPYSGDKAKDLADALEFEQARPITPRYEEYEQATPSPWSQSPAPSPAIRSDPMDNPFFSDATIDEESFNPASPPADYTNLPAPEAIGLESSWTVLHIPLTHVLLSRHSWSSRNGAAAMLQKQRSQSKEDSHESSRDTLRKEEAAPIAILSLLCPIIPYPPNLQQSLEQLAPHMATSFSLCRHYTNLETELAGIQRRRPQTSGFGAVAPYGRTVESNLAMAADPLDQPSSLGGSITSPSDYSGISKSATGSPLGTPGWEQSSMGSLMDKRHAGSPAALAQAGTNYFSSKQPSSSSKRQDMLSPGFQRPRAGSKDAVSAEKKTPFRLSKSIIDPPSDDEASNKGNRKLERAKLAQLRQEVAPVTGYNNDDGDETLRSSTLEELPEPHRLERTQTYEAQSHTMLHSYGADFAATFPSLPPSSTVLSRPAGPARSVSLHTSAIDLPPPSDRLKGLILDSLPAHVFVSLPQSGEIVWVNSRYLSYRGQSVNDLTADPWKSLHPDDREEYLKAWGHSLRTGEQFSRTVRIKRFDGAYRWFYARAVASKDKRGVIMQFLGSYMDIHDQHIAELKAARQEEIEASEAKHRQLANLIPQIIFTATEDDGVTFANEQWLWYTGQSFEDALGLGFLDFVHPEDLAKCQIPLGRRSSREQSEQRLNMHEDNGNKSSKDQSTRTVHFGNKSPKKGPTFELPQADLATLAKSGIVRVSRDSNGRLSYTSEVRLRSKSGEYRWHLIRCVEIDTIDFGRGASSYFGSATDINDHKLLEEKLKEAMESKGRFLSNMSHEIRTPLIGISGMVSFLQETLLDEEQRDYTNTIHTSANSLIMIINDILDLSKADAGMMKLKFEWFHTRSLIEDVNELVSTMAIAKGLELNYLVEADVPAWVKGDKVRIRQVLLNVIGNAIKFTEKGEVFSHCRVLGDDSSQVRENEIMLEFSITDTGRGFSQQEAELIFKPFSQIDGSSTRQHGGSGLGLVISRQLVELHGGKMEGSAVLGEGSTFTFTALFSLPTSDDYPSMPHSPGSTVSGLSRNDSSDGAKGSPQLAATKRSSEVSGRGEMRLAALSAPIISRTGTSQGESPNSPTETVLKMPNTGISRGLARFSEAAKASGQDLTQMKLTMSPDSSSSGRTSTPDQPPRFRQPSSIQPPIFSILIVCPQRHSRDATVQHIEMTLPKDVPHQITAIGTVEEAHELIGGDDPVKFTHIVINLGSAEAIISLMDEITRSQKLDRTIILILSDSVQRQAVLKVAAGTKYEKLLSENTVSFIYKPVKPSRFAVIFDPEKVRDTSTDLNRSSAQQMLENQKASSEALTKLMGNRGLRILVVEDNKINQVVLRKYLEKIGVEVEIAADGVECTDLVLHKPHNFYSIILCDIQMPRKDGFETCKDIRDWERANDLPEIPIIALSANVLTVMHERCAAAGFSDYVSKPVDFISLSKAMARYF